MRRTTRRFVKRLDPEKMAAFYKGARFLVVPSKWFEGCPLVVLEAMSHGLPVIASRIGGLPEFVEDGVTGLLFEPGNASELADKIRLLWSDPELCRRMGAAGRKKALREYNEEVYYQGLTAIYDQAIDFNAQASTEQSLTEVLNRTSMNSGIKWPPKYGLFGVQVSAATCTEACDAILQAAHAAARGRLRFLRSALVEASTDPGLRSKANRFAVITPDGQPVRWALNWLHGAGLRHNVRGSELMWSLCRARRTRGDCDLLVRQFADHTRRAAQNLIAAFPTIEIAGAESPPFRPLSAAEDAAMVERVNASGAGLVFLGLGCPKQDHFAAQHVDRIQAVQLCVGAAFDFHAGSKATAPRWMQRHGFEWLFRLYQEPGRLWKRYLTTNTIFLAKLMDQFIRERLLRLSTAAADQANGS